MTAWRTLSRSSAELRCALTLRSGQTFGWRATTGGGAPSWVGCVSRRWAFELRERGELTEYRVLGAVPPSSDEAAEAALRSYFRLGEEDLASLMARWSAADARFAAIAPFLRGLRLMRSEPVECLFSFLTSSNNNIPRITALLARLRARAGRELARPDDGGEPVRAFPALEDVAALGEDELREMGFGYRSPFIAQTARLLVERGGEQYLTALRSVARVEARAALVQLRGVGPKVADCVALFSLEQHGCVPVDVHVKRIAEEEYGDLLPATTRGVKTLTPTVYEGIGDFFRGRFGAHAGWAHCVLFSAELGEFKARLPAALQRSRATAKVAAAAAAAAHPGKRAREADGDETVADDALAAPAAPAAAAAAVALPARARARKGARKRPRK